MEELRSTLRADLAVTSDWQARITIRVLRWGQYLIARRSLGRRLAYRGWKVMNAAWTQAVCGSDLPPQATYGPGLNLRHGGRGLVVHPEAIIGANAKILPRVTVGMASGRGAPEIGDGVRLGIGCSVLGRITVGDRVSVGAAAVVIDDVPSDSIAVGIPARVKPRRDVQA